MESWVEENTIVEQTLQCHAGMTRFIQKYDAKALRDLQVKLKDRLQDLETHELQVVFKGIRTFHSRNADVDVDSSFSS